MEGQIRLLARKLRKSCRSSDPIFRPISNDVSRLNQTLLEVEEEINDTDAESSIVTTYSRENYDLLLSNCEKDLQRLDALLQIRSLSLRTLTPTFAKGLELVLNELQACLQDNTKQLGQLIDSVFESESGIEEPSSAKPLHEPRSTEPEPRPKDQAEHDPPAGEDSSQNLNATAETVTDCDYDYQADLLEEKDGDSSSGESGLTVTGDNDGSHVHTPSSEENAKTESPFFSDQAADTPPSESNSDKKERIAAWTKQTAESKQPRPKVKPVRKPAKKTRQQEQDPKPRRNAGKARAAQVPPPQRQYEQQQPTRDPRPSSMAVNVDFSDSEGEDIFNEQSRWSTEGAYDGSSRQPPPTRPKTRPIKDLKKVKKRMPTLDELNDDIRRLEEEKLMAEHDLRYGTVRRRHPAVDDFNYNYGFYDPTFRDPMAARPQRNHEQFRPLDNQWFENPYGGAHWPYYNQFQEPGPQYPGNNAADQWQQQPPFAYPNPFQRPEMPYPPRQDGHPNQQPQQQPQQKQQRATKSEPLHTNRVKGNYVDMNGKIHPYLY